MNAIAHYSKLDKHFELTPEIIKINASFEEFPHKLFVTIENNNSDRYATIVFQRVEGFRVIDEADLLDFWQIEELPDSWIWEIKSGGWFDKEKQNNGFPILSSTQQLREYFVVGCGMCVNVICSGNEQPEVQL